jgi:hypothetical protein
VQVEQAVFLRIDTANNQPYFANAASAELVVSELIAGKDKGWYELLGFVVLPCELQLLVLPRRVAASAITASLEAAVFPRLTALQPVAGAVFDTDIYREKVDCDEETRQRLRWMHLAPVRARLTTMANAYPFSSASPNCAEQLRTRAKLSG